MRPDDFQLPALFDYMAIFAWALSGAIVGLRKRYDLVGVFITAALSSIGGGIVRDGILLHRTPPVLTDPYYLPLISLATVIIFALRSRIEHTAAINKVVSLIDSIATPAFAVVGLQLGARSGLPVLGILVIGCVSAVGGGILRDVVVRDEPELLRPGQFVAIPVAICCAAYLALTLHLHFAPTPIAWGTIAAYFVIRLLVIRLDWQTRPLVDA